MDLLAVAMGWYKQEDDAMVVVNSDSVVTRECQGKREREREREREEREEKRQRKNSKVISC